MYIYFTGKRQHMYQRVFAMLKREVHRVTGHEWLPRSIICDFELAMHQAIRAEMPQCHIQCCYFHYCQALWRHVMTGGLEPLYRTDEDVCRLVRLQMSIGFLPVQDVVPAFEAFRNAQHTQHLEQLHPGITVWMDYVRDTYLGAGSFPVAIWNVHERDIRNRTNNHCEGHYSVWNKLFVSAHPGLFTFIRHLKELQVNREICFASMDRGDPPVRPTAKWRRHEAAITRLKEDFTQGARTRDDYWVAITHHITSFV